MAAVRVRFKGLDKVRNFLHKLPKKLDKHLSKTNRDFMEDFKNTAIELAPEDTGELKASIKLEPVKKGKNTKQWAVSVGALHGIFQEEGYSPHYAYIRNSSKLRPGVYYVKKNTPFMRPAFKRVKAKYLNMLKVSTNRAIANAGGK